MRSLVASPPIVTAWLAKWAAIGGTICIIGGKAYSWRVPRRPDADASAAAALQAEFDASPWMERGVRVFIEGELRARVLDLLDEPVVTPLLTPTNQAAGPAAAAIAWAEQKRHTREAKRRAKGDAR